MTNDLTAHSVLIVQDANGNYDCVGCSMNHFPGSNPTRINSFRVKRHVDKHREKGHPIHERTEKELQLLARQEANEQNHSQHS